MSSPLAFRPARGPLSELGALVACAYLGAPAAVAFTYSNPIVLAGAGIAVLGAGLAAGARDALATSLRWGAALGVLIVAVNGLASQRGDTVLVRGGELPLLGRLDVSAEALAEGGVLALRIVVVLAAFAVLSACVDPDRILRQLRPVARHSALTATLIARAVPLALADHARLREAAALRGPGATPLGRGALLRRLLAGTLDRAVDVAATLELRGYAHGPPRARGSGPPSRHGSRFALAALALGLLALGGHASGIGGFTAYPTVELDAGVPTLAFAAALGLLAIAPFAGASGGGRG